jgi:hypothetical protein
MRIRTRAALAAGTVAVATAAVLGAGALPALAATPHASSAIEDHRTAVHHHRNGATPKHDDPATHDRGDDHGGHGHGHDDGPGHH